jgi:chorismate dehydratase
MRISLPNYFSLNTTFASRMMPESPIRVAAVSYSNTYPFLHGLQQSTILGAMELQLDTPSECARKLLSGQVDLGLVPIAVIPFIKDAHIISDYCIGADGAVESVCLFSQVRLEEITEILLDFQSRTSVQLMRILAERHFHISPKWTNTQDGYIAQIKGTTAGVVIGDRAFGLHSQFPVVVDLAFEWKHLTGLPFAFACWVSNKQLSESFIQDFNQALRYGVEHREDAIRERVPHNTEAMLHYVNHCISYSFDGPKKQAMQLFHQWSSQM